MKKSISILLVFIVLVASTLFAQEKPKVPKWYPSTKTHSKREMKRYESKYNRFINTYHLENVKGGVDSINAHLKYIRFNDKFKICNFTNTTDSIEVFKNKIFSFYRYWWRIFSNERFEIDSSRIFIDDGGCLQGRFTIKHPYDPSLNILKRELGSLSASVDSEGHLFYMHSSLVPHLRIPNQPLITKSEAFRIIEGYTFTINQPIHLYHKTFTLTREKLNDPELTVYTQKINKKSLKYRLVWRFQTREVIVYIDAMTGDIIEHKITLLFM